MKFKLILMTLALSACGRAPVTTSSSLKDDTATTTKSACAVYASTTLDAYKTVNPLSEAVTASEKAMIQTAVLVSGIDTPVTPDEALDIFTDKENDGSLGGAISYFKVTVNNKEKTIASVAYFPGDNEYGALFQIHTYGNGDTSASLIGTIGDSDVYCLTYVETRD
jgi:hypothetical protein